MYGLMDTIPYAVEPLGRRDWFYTLFGPCFAKPFVEDDRVYHKVLWFKYTTDGKKCWGIYFEPGESYPPEAEEINPDCFFCWAFIFRFIRRNICCDRSW